MKILGVDIGGSGIKGTIVETETGDFLAERHRIPTPNPSTPDAVAKVLRKLTRYFEWNGPVGCGFPAVIRNGVARTASNIHKDWIGTDVIQLFSERTNCPVQVLNDADAAGIAEMTFGAGRDQKGLAVLITVGTGLGSSLFTNGQLFPNTEFGQLLLNGKIAEKYASDAVRKNLDLSWKKWAKRFDEYLHHLEMLLWPDVIILGGGVSKKMDKFAHYLTVKTEVIPARLQNHAGIIGAALFAEQKIKADRTERSNR